MGEAKPAVTLSPYTVDDVIVQKYMEAFTGSPFSAYDLEFVLDCDKGHMLREYYNFDPKRVMSLLIYRAVTQGIAPEQLHKDVYGLIYWKNIEPKSEKDRKHFDTLVEKYSVTEKGNEIYAITYERLAFMYPHYYLKFMKDKALLKNTPEISAMFQYPEFGGLIPSAASGLKEETRRRILTLHLYCLSRTVSIPLRTHIVLLKKRIETGLLSDTRRVRFFENHKITLQGALTDESKLAVEMVERGFSQSIDWGLLK